MKIVTAAEMREIDRATSERFGVHSLTLMENAGASVADFVLSHYSSARRIVVICGRGNNGGDGFVAARRLHQRGKHVQVVLLADPAELRGDAREMFSKVPVPVMAVHSSEEWKPERVQLTLHAELYIDAILGTGFKPPVSGLYAEALPILNASTTPVVAVDIPSGADADVMGHQTGAVARANAIVTFTAPRLAHVFGELTDGPTYVAPIGSPDEAITSSLGLNVITAKDIPPLVAPRVPDAHKGSFGHVLILGGSVGKAGAAAMAGIAALRVGAGLSTVATPPASRRNGAPDRLNKHGSAARPLEHRSHLRAGASTDSRPQRPSHAHCSAGWHGLGQYDRQSGNGNRRNRGHSHGDDCRFYRTKSGANFGCCSRRGASPRPGRGCGS